MIYLKKSVILMLGFIVCGFLCFPKDAYAYIDPGTGSYIFQMLIALVVGGMFFLNLFWVKIKVFLANLFSSKDKQEDHEEE